jgi:tetratricopeptide (TPR) repeat protein
MKRIIDPRTEGFIKLPNVLIQLGWKLSNQMYIGYRSSQYLSLLLLLIALSLHTIPVWAQESSTETEKDPVALFEQGQSAHEKGDLKRAIQLYEEALDLHSEFPEALYQKANALISLNRLSEAEEALRETIGLRADWAAPKVTLGTLLSRTNRDKDAEEFLQEGIKLDSKNIPALMALADIRLRAKKPNEAVEFLMLATSIENSKASIWLARSRAERAAGDKVAAMASIENAIKLDNTNNGARFERANLNIDNGKYEEAIKDLETVRPVSSSTNLQLAKLYALTNRKDEAVKLLDTLDEDSKKSADAISLRIQLLGNRGSDKNSITELEKLLEGDPKNVSVLVRLGSLLRTVDPQRSLEYYRRAAELEPNNIDHATGYAAALVQAKRFEDAVIVLKKVLNADPNNAVAHTNLATALYELKNFPEALEEYRWILKAKPDLVITNYFIAIVLDKMGNYEEALASYEKFLAAANREINSLEIDKVELRLPILRKQIAHGKGEKKKK